MAPSIAAGSASHDGVVATLRTSTPNSWPALSNDGCAVIGNTMFGRVVGRCARRHSRAAFTARKFPSVPPAVSVTWSGANAPSKLATAVRSSWSMRAKPGEQ
jgi:hypothetical protein